MIFRRPGDVVAVLPVFAETQPGVYAEDAARIAEIIRHDRKTVENENTRLTLEPTDTTDMGPWLAEQAGEIDALVTHGLQRAKAAFDNLAMATDQQFDVAYDIHANGRNVSPDNFVYEQ